MIGWQIMTQPIKSNIDYCLIQSCEWSLLLISHMIAYIKPAFYNSESIRPMNMKFFVHINFLVEWNILTVRLNSLTSFWDMGDWNFMILVGVATIRLIDECRDWHYKHHTDMPYCGSHKICIIDKQLQQLPIASNLQCSLHSNCNCNYNCFHSNSNCSHVRKADHHSVVAGYFT